MSVNVFLNNYECCLLVRVEGYEGSFTKLMFPEDICKFKPHPLGRAREEVKVRGRGWYARSILRAGLGASSDASISPMKHNGESRGGQGFLWVPT